MVDEPALIWRDTYDPGRLSAGRRCASMKEWIEGLRPQIPAKAYYGCLGWAYAKYVAMSDRRGALKLYLRAVFHGCYRPSLAGIIFLQIFLSDGLYRRIADGAIKWLRAGPPAKAA
jgi:hypothetical protein